MQHQNDKVKDYYTATVCSYELAWYSQKTLALHFGYYDETTRWHRHALVKINEVLSNMASITHNDYVLDAGCGVGGSAIWLAKHRNCNVVGINIVFHQLEKAKRYTQDNNVSHLVNYDNQDYTNTTFADKTFSVVWGHESICHTDRKKEFIHEAYRILKDDGRLIIAECMLRETPEITTTEQQIIHEWLTGWAMHSLLTVSHYISLLKEAGFKRIEVHDITENTLPSLRRLNRLTLIPGWFISLCYKFGIGRNMTIYYQLLCKNVQASYYQYNAFQLGTWRYKVIVAYKY